MIDGACALSQTTQFPLSFIELCSCLFVFCAPSIVSMECRYCNNGLLLAANHLNLSYKHFCEILFMLLDSAIELNNFLWNN